MSQNFQYLPNLKKILADSICLSIFFIITVPNIVNPETVNNSFAFASYAAAKSDM